MGFCHCGSRRTIVFQHSLECHGPWMVFGYKKGIFSYWLLCRAWLCRRIFIPYIYTNPEKMHRIIMPSPLESAVNVTENIISHHQGICRKINEWVDLFAFDRTKQPCIVWYFFFMAMTKKINHESRSVLKSFVFQIVQNFVRFDKILNLESMFYFFFRHFFSDKP